MIFSAGVDQLAIVAYVPAKEGQDHVAFCEEWLKAVLQNFGGEVVNVGAGMCQGRVLADGDKNVFPLKIREPMILESNNFLRKKGLFPEDHSDDDEMVRPSSSPPLSRARSPPPSGSWPASPS